MRCCTLRGGWVGGWVGRWEGFLPAAPRECPVMDLMEEILSLRACSSPKTRWEGGRGCVVGGWVVELVGG